MGMRRRRRRQQDELFITADRLPKSDGHAFYQKLNLPATNTVLGVWFANLRRR